MAPDNAPKTEAGPNLITNKIACFAYLTRGLFAFKLNKYWVVKHENYKNNDFIGLFFCDSWCCFFPAFRFANKHAICSANL
jgi:hypothetical protein